MAAIRDEIKKGNTYFFTQTLQYMRTLFRFRSDLYESKMNFKNKYRHEGYICDSCESESDESTHVLFALLILKLGQISRLIQIQTFVNTYSKYWKSEQP